MVINHADVEELVTESQRLRDELMRTAAKLEAFSEQLLVEVAQLREAAYGDGSGDTGTDSDGSGVGKPD